MSDEMNGSDKPEAIDKERLAEMLQGLFGAKPVDSTVMTTNLLVQTMYGVLHVMSDAVPPGKLVDSVFNACAYHVGAALASLEASGMFIEGQTVAGSIDEMVQLFGKEIVKQYEEGKQRLKDEGEWPEEKDEDDDALDSEEGMKRDSKDD